VALEPGDEQIAFLGTDDDGPLFAVSRAGAELVNLRDLAARVPGERAGLLAYASALANWARVTRFCGICGTTTTAHEGGHLRRCENGHQHHPRTDPVVIMLVIDGDRALLGRQASWPAGRYSALAGFVEPGESLETAVAREVREEAGIAVDEVRYVAAQPWPFPVSLMLGFHARYAGGEATTMDAELEAVTWFTRDEMAAAAAAGAPAGEDWLTPAPDGALVLPPPIAIARLLIDTWLAEGTAG
jgi:NAD+ diphosphatase